MIADDAWATVGSANLHRRSLTGNAELDLAIWDVATARGRRCALTAEHLAEDVTALDDRAALRRFALVARANRHRRDAGMDAWQGRAFDLRPAAG